MIQIALYKGTKGIISKAIRWQTDSPYSHAALLFDRSTLIESHAGKGVASNKFVKTDDWDVFSIKGMTHDAEIKAYYFALDQIGQGYDYWGCARFISRRRLPDNDKWFCSELVFAALQEAGINLLERIEAQQVSPGMLAYSPYLVKE